MLARVGHHGSRRGVRVLKALIQFDLRSEQERITSCDVGTNQRVGHGEEGDFELMLYEARS